MTVEELAERILAHVPQGQHRPEDLGWFLSDEAAEAAEEMRGAAVLPDGRVLILAVHVLGWHSLCRYIAGAETDLAELGRAVLCFLDVHRFDPGSVPAPWGPSSRRSRTSPRERTPTRATRTGRASGPSCSTSRTAIPTRSRPRRSCCAARSRASPGTASNGVLVYPTSAS